jgi:hypothetical protein
VLHKNEGIAVAQTVQNYDKIPIRIVSSAGDETPGSLAVQRWEGKVKLERAIKLSLKILGCVLAPCCVAPFVHVLIIPSVTLLTLTIIVLPYVFSRFMGQSMTFLFAEGKCPYCGVEGRLNHYLQISVTESFTLICPKCGQTCKGHASPESFGTPANA